MLGTLSDGNGGHVLKVDTPALLTSCFGLPNKCCDSGMLVNVTVCNSV